MGTSARLILLFSWIVVNKHLNLDVMNVNHTEIHA